MALKNADRFPERTSWIPNSLRNSTRRTLIAQHPGDGVDHHDAGIGPQERAMERGVLLQIGQALSSVNHIDLSPEF